MLTLSLKLLRKKGNYSEKNSESVLSLEELKKIPVKKRTPEQTKLYRKLMEKRRKESLTQEIGNISTQKRMGKCGCIAFPTPAKTCQPFQPTGATLPTLVLRSKELPGAISTGTGSICSTSSQHLSY